MSGELAGWLEKQEDSKLLKTFRRLWVLHASAITCFFLFVACLCERARSLSFSSNNAATIYSTIGPWTTSRILSTISRSTCSKRPSNSWCAVAMCVWCCLFLCTSSCDRRAIKRGLNCACVTRATTSTLWVRTIVCFDCAPARTWACVVVVVVLERSEHAPLLLLDVDSAEDAARWVNDLNNVLRQQALAAKNVCLCACAPSDAKRLTRATRANQAVLNARSTPLQLSPRQNRTDLTAAR